MHQDAQESGILAFYRALSCVISKIKKPPYSPGLSSEFDAGFYENLQEKASIVQYLHRAT
jgi:hypothetical protein